MSSVDKPVQYQRVVSVEEKESSIVTKIDLLQRETGGGEFAEAGLSGCVFASSPLSAGFEGKVPNCNSCVLSILPGIVYCDGLQETYGQHGAFHSQVVEYTRPNVGELKTNIQTIRGQGIRYDQQSVTQHGTLFAYLISLGLIPCQTGPEIFSTNTTAIPDAHL